MAASDDVKEIEARRQWKNSLAGPVLGNYCDEDIWPPLPGTKVIPVAAKASSTTKNATPAKVKLGAFVRNGVHKGYRALPAALENRAPVPDSSSSPPMPHPRAHNNNKQANGAGSRGHQMNGCFAPHPHGSRGYNSNRSTRPGGGDVNDNVHVHVHNNLNRGGDVNSNSGQQHRDGRTYYSSNGNGTAHRPSTAPRMEAPAPRHPITPPSMSMMPRPTPYYDMYDAYGLYAYFPELGSSDYYCAAPQEGFPPFMSCHSNTMPSHWEHKGTSSGPPSWSSSPSLYMEPQQQPTEVAPLTTRELKELIRKQIEYYFSNENLPGDIHLKGLMDQNGGWVALTEIAKFNRIKVITDDLGLITASLLLSNKVEVQNGRIRKRQGWENYISAPQQRPGAPGAVGH